MTDITHKLDDLLQRLASHLREADRSELTAEGCLGDVPASAIWFHWANGSPERSTARLSSPKSRRSLIAQAESWPGRWSRLPGADDERQKSNRREVTHTLFAFAQAEAETEAAAAGTPVETAYALDDLRPDPGQPRQVLPPDLAGRLAGDEMAPAEALAEMQRRAEAGDEALARRLRSLRKLAASIEQHGLINPVTLHRNGQGRLLVETGERRYWAHWLLALDGGQEEFKHIEGREMTNESTRARQLIENLQREDLNAVEKARGLWALRYELSGVNHGAPSNNRNADGISPEVNHGAPLVPWGKVQEALGMSKRYRIYTLSVLNLCDEAQALVVEHDLAERLIRPVAAKLKGRPDLQVLALKTTVDEGLSVKAAEELVEKLLASKDQKEQEQVAKRAAKPTRPELLHRRVQATLTFVDRLAGDDLFAMTEELITTREYEPILHHRLSDGRARFPGLRRAGRRPRRGPPLRYRPSRAGRRAPLGRDPATPGVAI